MDSIKEYFAQYTISTKVDNVIIVHYQIYANKELSFFEMKASFLYLYNDFTSKSVVSRFQELKSVASEDKYISSIKIDIDHKKESISIDKEENIKDLEIENIVFNEAIKLIKEHSNDSYKVVNLDALENVASLEEKVNKDFKILSNKDILNRFKELGLEAYELREKNESLVAMTKGLYNEKMSIYKSIVVSLLLLMASGFLIAYM